MRNVDGPSAESVETGSKGTHRAPDYEIFVVQEGSYPYNKPVFECDCGRELAAEITECDRCGAHYEIEAGQVIQVAPPIELDDSVEFVSQDTLDDGGLEHE